MFGWYVFIVIQGISASPLAISPGQLDMPISPGGPVLSMTLNPPMKINPSTDSFGPASPSRVTGIEMLTTIYNAVSTTLPALDEAHCNAARDRLAKAPGVLSATCVELESR